MNCSLFFCLQVSSSCSTMIILKRKCTQYTSSIIDSLHLFPKQRICPSALVCIPGHCFAVSQFCNSNKTLKCDLCDMMSKETCHNTVDTEGFLWLEIMSVLWGKQNKSEQLECIFTGGSLQTSRGQSCSPVSHFLFPSLQLLLLQVWSCVLLNPLQCLSSMHRLVNKLLSGSPLCLPLQLPHHTSFQQTHTLPLSLLAVFFPMSMLNPGCSPLSNLTFAPGDPFTATTCWVFYLM